MKKIIKTYGPYVYRSGNKLRRFVIHHYDDGTKRTQSNARFLLERHLGRPLKDDEDADHIDGDPLNDELSNLRPLDSSLNRSLGSPPMELHYFTCPACGVEAVKPMSEVRSNWKKARQGPFCTRSCASRYTYVAPKINTSSSEEVLCKYGHVKDGWDRRNGKLYRKCLTCARERERLRRSRA